jgi:two-component system cell cycle sensor histidine kinase/response regulator CckA
MAEALERIERTAKRVQAFARPRGITLQSTDANQAVEATLEMLGPGHGKNIQIRSELGDVAPVQGDPYTLQEVLFNLCTNALIAMPRGGTLTLRTYALGRKDEDQMGSVAIDVSDTGVGIPRLNLEKIFEPFFTAPTPAAPAWVSDSAACSSPKWAAASKSAPPSVKAPPSP